jgi:hypothetical protein
VSARRPSSSRRWRFLWYLVFLSFFVLAPPPALTPAFFLSLPASPHCPSLSPPPPFPPSCLRQSCTLAIFLSLSLFQLSLKCFPAVPFLLLLLLLSSSVTAKIIFASLRARDITHIRRGILCEMMGRDAALTLRGSTVVECQTLGCAHLSQAVTNVIGVPVSSMSCRVSDEFEGFPSCAR